MMGWTKTTVMEDTIARHDIEAHLKECVTYRTRADDAFQRIDRKQDDLQAAHFRHVENTLAWRGVVTDKLNTMAQRALVSMVTMLLSALVALVGVIGWIADHFMFPAH